MELEKNKEGVGFFDGINLVELANKLGTPFFLMSERKIRENHSRIVKSLEGIGKLNVYYSVKTNFESGVLKTLAGLGCGAEIASGLELHLSEKAGFTPEKIVFDGPCKFDGDIEYSIQEGVHLINAESCRELERINELSRKKKRVTNVGLRIDPEVGIPFYDKVFMTYKQKFGVPQDEVLGIAKKTRGLENIRLCGLHTHIGSQLLDPELYATVIEKMFKLASEMKEESGVEITELNLGGGFPVGSMRGVLIPDRLQVFRLSRRLGVGFERKTPALEEFGERISGKFNQLCDLHKIEPALAIEPGRSIASTAGILVAKIVLKKGGWIFLDEGRNLLPETPFLHRRDIVVVNKMGNPLEEVLHVAGPTLDTGDVLLVDKKLPKTEEGDIVAILDAGAYSISRSTQFTHERRTPVYFIKKDGEIIKIRNKEGYEDVTRNMIF